MMSIIRRLFPKAPVIKDVPPPPADNTNIDDNFVYDRSELEEQTQNVFLTEALNKETPNHMTSEEKENKVSDLVTRIRVINAEEKAKNPFYLHDGRVLNSLEDLKKALNNMSDDTWRHHVRGDNNDFANWIRDCLNDYLLSEQVRKAATPSELALLLTQEEEHDLMPDTEHPFSTEEQVVLGADDIRQGIIDIHSLIEDNRFNEARKKYGMLKKALEDNNTINDQEARKLLNLLHELYTEMHLARLTQAVTR